MSHQGNKSKQRANYFRGRAKMEDIVQIPLSGLDASKDDDKTLIL